jgi:hypothetical protein
MAMRLAKFNPAREKARKEIVRHAKPGSRKTYMSGPEDSSAGGRDIANMHTIDHEIFRLYRLFTYEAPKTVAGLINDIANDKERILIVDPVLWTANYKVQN